MEVNDIKVIDIKHLTNTCSYEDPAFGKFDDIQICVIRVKEENCLFRLFWKNDIQDSGSFIFNRLLDAIICVGGSLFAVDKLLIFKLGIEKAQTNE